MADEHVEPEFGTGALKVTPGHDPRTSRSRRRHGLPAVNFIGEDGRMTDEAGSAIAGLTRPSAPARVVEDLRAEGLLRAEEPYTHNVPSPSAPAPGSSRSSRCSGSAT